MASSELYNSSGNRFSNGSRNFTQTCNLLSQYLKKTKGGGSSSFGDLSLGLIPTPKSEPPPIETMDLLPMIEKSGGGNRMAADVEEIPNKSAPMTIFYAGQVIVFNDFPADKAKEIMMLAGKSAVSPAPKIVAAAIGSDLPLARKNSLARFLEKRKDRIMANAPYSKKGKLAVAKKEEEGWNYNNNNNNNMGISAHQFSLLHQMQHHHHHQNQQQRQH